MIHSNIFILIAIFYILSIRKSYILKKRILIVFEASRSYYLKFDKLIVPMAKGYRSKRVLDIAFALSREHDSEITAFTVKDSVREITWSDKVSLVTDAYKEGKLKNIKVVPKVHTFRSVREGIVEEVNKHGYDMLLIASAKRSPLSTSLFGGIGDYVLKNSKVTTVAASVKNSNFPYSKILVPVSEFINTRAAVSFALYLKKALGSSLTFADLRKYDKKRTHGFNMLFDNMDEVLKTFGSNIDIIRSGFSTSIRDEVQIIAKNVKPNAIVVGIRSGPEGRIRINSSIKSIIKESSQDAILVKK